MKIPYQLLFLLMTILFGVNSASAGIQLQGTRVIYPANQREVSLGIINNGTEARLVQAWVDSGDLNESPDKSQAPFLVTPPMSRVDPGKGQTLRIMYSGRPIAQDRESVFWLNVLEIPPKPQQLSASSNFVQMAIRSRIKVFYRPTGLPGSPEAAIGQLKWSLKKNSGNKVVMQCTNDTPYNVSFSDVSFKGGVKDNRVSKGGMCPAKGTADFQMYGSAPRTNTERKLSLTVVNDFGGFNSHEAVYN